MVSFIANRLVHQVYSITLVPTHTHIMAHDHEFAQNIIVYMNGTFEPQELDAL